MPNFKTLFQNNSEHVKTCMKNLYSSGINFKWSIINIVSWNSVWILKKKIY